jgi:tetratricopeptide (TPR) repeat protein
MAYNNRGLSYYRKSKYDQAILDYTKAIELSPKDGRAYLSRALAYDQKKIMTRRLQI